jgi:primosomal protein N' (replication factor Y)
MHGNGKVTRPEAAAPRHIETEGEREAGGGGFCRVALPRPVLQTFAYRVPDHLSEAARPGVRARVPLGRTRQVGLVVERMARPGRRNLRDVADILDREPLLDSPLLELCDWIARYYVAPPGLVYRAALPPGFLGDAGAEVAPELRRKVIRIERELPTLLERDALFGRAARQREAYDCLEAMGGSSSLAHMERQLGFSRSVLKGLVDRGVAEIADEVVSREPMGDDGEPASLPHSLTAAQTEVLDGLVRQAAEVEPGVALLRGVTGSGKTVVYLRLIEELRLRGRSAIVLVPEISLTPQTVQRFRSSFDAEVAILHSALSAGERHDEWKALREGRKRVVVGTRSAIFAPVREPGVIILDEEHDGSYKQSETPRYHARAVAAVRARLEGALCLLGSATPSLESWHNALGGRYRLYELPERATPHPLPRVELVDLRRDRPSSEQRREEKPGPSVLTPRLRDAVRHRLAREEQSILLLNRRGYSTFLQCGDCGWVGRCRRCNVSLTFHRRRKRLVCHHCGFDMEIPIRCGQCGSTNLTYSGLGTEQVERRLGEEFPAARIVRMDVDTTGGKGAHRRILESVRRRQVDILLGTQMISKGLDFPGVTLVGVINADVGLNLPDFRASERTFQLLAQVAGRAGRGPSPGEVLIQTSRPNHGALRAAVSHDYEGFARSELEDRAGPGYPPHLRLANLVVSGTSEQAVADAAGHLTDWTRGLIDSRQLEDVRVLGPAPCPIDRLRSRWRWHFLIKADRPASLGPVLRQLARRHGLSGPLRLEIDRDPEALL